MDLRVTSEGTTTPQCLDYDPAHAVRAGSATTLGSAGVASAPATPVAPRPPLDLTKVAVVGEVVAGTVAIAWRMARRPVAPKANVRMGPGGWVSLKGGSVRLNGRRYLPATEQDRPWWAHLLRAHRTT